jgi:hypothetical protein
MEDGLGAAARPTLSASVATSGEHLGLLAVAKSKQVVGQNVGPVASQNSK